MKVQKEYKLKMQPDVYYVWVAGACDYGHEERCSGGAYNLQRNEEILETYVTSDAHTTEFRMILTVMIHAMEEIPSGSDIISLTNVSYIQQNFDRKPQPKSANPDLINECRKLKEHHNSVSVKLVSFHKYHLLTETNTLAHEAMLELRKKWKKK